MFKSLAWLSHIILSRMKKAYLDHRKEKRFLEDEGRVYRTAMHNYGNYAGYQASYALAASRLGPRRQSEK